MDINRYNIKRLFRHLIGTYVDGGQNKKPPSVRLEVLERWSGRATLLILFGIIGEIVLTLYFPDEESWYERCLKIFCDYLIAVALIIEYFCILRTIKATDELQRESNERVATAEAQAIMARVEIAKAKERTEQLRADNLALQIGVKPRRLSFMGWTTDPERIAKIYNELKPYAGTITLIQVVPDFEAQMFARDIVAVLSANGWKPRIITERESHMSDLSFPEGVTIFTLSDGKSQTQAGTALWTVMIQSAHEMSAKQFVDAPIHEILDVPKPGYPYFEPPIIGVFVRVGIRQTSSQLLEIQRREFIRQNEDWDDNLKNIIKSGRKLMGQATDGSTVEIMIRADGKLVAADPNKKLLEINRDLTLVLPNGIMIRSSPPVA